jgi:predicted deacylase
MNELPLGTDSLRLHGYRALQPGPRLIVLGAVHGNETAGTRGIERTLTALDRGDIRLQRGAVTLVPVTNPLAYARGQRFGERNLNRRLLPTPDPHDNEDRIANVLCPLLAQHDVLLDLHSFRGQGLPFALRGPADNDGPLEPFARADAEARLAAHLGVQRVVDGWLPAYAAGVVQRRQRALTPGAGSAASEDPAYGIGTTEYMRSVGGYAVTLECGAHDDPEGPRLAQQAIRQTLALLGIAALPLAPPPAAIECLTLVEVVDRHAVGDRFVKPWASFDPVAAGEPIAERADGKWVHAPYAGCIVFPDVGARPGHEWFYLARPSRRPL